MILDNMQNPAESAHAHLGAYKLVMCSSSMIFSYLRCNSCLQSSPIKEHATFQLSLTYQNCFRRLVNRPPELVEPVFHLLPPHHGAHSLHDVCHQLGLHIVADPLLFLFLKLDVEQLDEELDGGALQEDSEEDHGKAGCDEELAVPELNIEDNNQGETNSSSQTS